MKDKSKLKRYEEEIAKMMEEYSQYREADEQTLNSVRPIVCEMKRNSLYRK